ncbi:hypothetical protein C497_06754 [Halalkalicoccus jeotgali B3]|uniref:Fido domain-containing protein n=1 Tax=Halalkalicoccus jeotgali (strain DSM 18796 / CECT 7217 / JCM 14584 / KCTC 4019 / B3) TaxID=795797 RepID=L9VN87_HALJB|nr:Fic family protein [Halalkalicoccus jeotgali]ELY38619.1 hypothetical protein C497_06754 [Halalkalicoccus jeotgali B3]
MTNSGDGTLPTAKDIVTVHDEIDEEYDLKYKGARVASPRLELRPHTRKAAEYDDVYIRAAFLLRKVVTAHVFEDGNKRTAWNVATSYLEQAGAQRADTDVAEARGGNRQVVGNRRDRQITIEPTPDG